MMSEKPILYSFYRSSCSWRVRIALAVKGIDYEYVAVNLAESEQLGEKYSSVNPFRQVPAMRIDGIILTQSNAIIEYLDETREGPPLLPKDPQKRFKCRELSQIISSGVHPVQKPNVRKNFADEKKWVQKVISEGFEAFEKRAEQTAGKFSVGDEISMADMCLVPQVFNAGRHDIDMTKYPVISRIYASMLELDVVKVAHPFRQPDCPEDLRQ